jgi:rod shape-determining protein MreD
MKIVSEKTVRTRSYRQRLVGYTAAMVILTIFHLTFLRYISLGNISPDLLIILCVWISLSEGRLVGIFAGFIIGLFYDFMSQDIIGSNALVKTIVAFIAGFFYVEEKTDQIIKSYMFLVIIILAALVHNLIYYLFHIDLSSDFIYQYFMVYGVASSIYTTFYGLFAMLLKIPGKRFKMIK